MNAADLFSLGGITFGETCLAASRQQLRSWASVAWTIWAHKRQGGCQHIPGCSGDWASFREDIDWYTGLRRWA